MAFKTLSPSRMPHDTPSYRQHSQLQKVSDNFSQLEGRLLSKTPTSAINTAGAGTYAASDILGGFIVRDPSGAGRSDTFSTAALLVAAMTNPAIGDIIRVKILNNADASEAITLLAGTGGSFGATNKTHTIAQNASLTVDIRITGVLSGSEAYVIYD